MKFEDLTITFHTNEIKECVAFYTKYFQAKVTFDAGWYVMIRLESGHTPPLHLSFQGSHDTMVRKTFSGGVTLNLLTADVDACYEQLVQTDVPFVERITDHEWGDRAFSVKDPIGNLVYIYSERKLADKYAHAVKE